MKRIDSCPVTHISLHAVMRELATRGVLGTKEVYHPGMGVGVHYTYNGEPLQFRMGFTGRLDGLNTNAEEPIVFSEPHDIAYIGSTKTLVTFAKSL